MDSQDTATPLNPRGLAAPAGVPPDQDVIARIRRSRELAHDDVSASMARLDMVVHEEGADPLAVAASPARRALVAVLRAYGLDDFTLKVGRAGPAAEEDVVGVARTSGVRLRRLVLPEAWWDDDHGHIIGFLRPDAGNTDRTERKVPVALVRGRTYKLHDPQGGAPVEVTSEVAQRLEPTAYDVSPPLPADMTGLVGLGKFLVPMVRRDLVVAAFAGAVIGLLGAMFPIAMAMIVDTLIPGNEMALLLQVGVGLAGAGVLSALFMILRQLAMLRIGGRTDIVLEAAVWDRLLKLPATFFQNYSSGDLTQRAGGIAILRAAAVNVVLTATITAVFSLFYLVLLFIYDVRLALIALAIVVLLAAVTLVVGLVQIRYHLREAVISGWLSGYVFQMLQGIVKLRVAGAEDRAFVHWADKYADERQAIVAARRITNHFTAFSDLYATLSLAAIYAATHYLAAAELSAGMFVAFLAAFGGFQGAFLGLSSAALQVFAALPHWDRAKPIFEAKPESTPAAADPGSLTGFVEVTGVTFGYGDGAPVLRDISLSIAPGENVALVGPSGSGKSTLVRLLLGMERPGSGTVLFDGQDISNLDLTLLRRQIGVVTQNGRLFAGTMMDNIRGGTSAPLEDCLEACRAAGLGDDLDDFPMGLHTPLTEGAPALSGGQRQRLLIARALVSRPRILVFDEATSSLDNRTQAIVTESLNRLAVTRLVIAHRLSTVQKADRIYVLEAGQVAEQGTYNELIAASGLFAELARRQMT